MKSCPPMCGKKNMPYAISTPDCQKILVFSTAKDQPRDWEFDDFEVSRIDNDPPSDDGFVDFELYDYVTGTSQPLPSLPDKSYYRLVAYYFMNDTTFVVRTDTHMAFTLDRSQYPNWKLIRDLPRVTGDGFQLCGGEGFVSMDGLHNLTEEYASAAFPSDPIFRAHGCLHSVLAAPVDRDKFCCLYVGFDFDIVRGLSVHIIVYENDPENPVKEEGTSLATIPKRSSQYAFEPSSYYEFFNPMAFFLTRATAK